MYMYVSRGFMRALKPGRRICTYNDKNVQIGNDQEKAQSERNSRSKNRGGKN